MFRNFFAAALAGVAFAQTELDLTTVNTSADAGFRIDAALDRIVRDATRYEVDLTGLTEAVTAYVAANADDRMVNELDLNPGLISTIKGAINIAREAAEAAAQAAIDQAILDAAALLDEITITQVTSDSAQTAAVTRLPAAEWEEALVTEAERIKEQLEAANGVKTDRIGKITKVDGTETVVNADGTYQTRKPNGRVIDADINGNITITDEDGSTHEIRADGSQKKQDASNNLLEFATDGTFYAEDAEGNAISLADDGTVTYDLGTNVTRIKITDGEGNSTYVKKNGEIEEFSVDGNVRIIKPDGTVTEEKRPDFEVPAADEIGIDLYEDTMERVTIYTESLKADMQALVESATGSSALFDEDALAKLEKRKEQEATKIDNYFKSVTNTINRVKADFDAGLLDEAGVVSAAEDLYADINKKLADQETKIANQESQIEAQAERVKARAENRKAPGRLTKAIDTILGDDAANYNFEAFKVDTLQGDWTIPIYRATSSAVEVTGTYPLLLFIEQGITPAQLIKHAKWILKLVDEGYDVWLGGYAGAEGSTSKVFGNKEAKFSTTWASAGVTDIPAQIEHIKTVSGAERVNVLAHSNANGSMLYGLAKHGADYFNENVERVIAVAPCIVKTMDTADWEGICDKFYRLFQKLNMYQTNDTDAWQLTKDYNTTIICNEFGEFSSECNRWAESTAGKLNLNDEFYQYQIWRAGAFVEPVSYEDFCNADEDDTRRDGVEVDISEITIPVHFWYNSDDTSCTFANNDFGSSFTTATVNTIANTGHEFWEVAGGDFFLSSAIATLETGDPDNYADYQTTQYTDEENAFWEGVFDGSTLWEDAMIELRPEIEGAAAEAAAAAAEAEAAAAEAAAAEPEAEGEE